MGRGSFWSGYGLLAAMVVGYAVIFSAAALYKHHSFWMGFDLAVHEQAIWNTIHGRLAEISPKAATHSYLGVDIIITELLLAPIYALVPRTETLLILQVAIAASGAVPIFLLARDRWRSVALESDIPSPSTARRIGVSEWVGLSGGILYLGSLPVQYAILYEFQIRTVGTVLLLWAFFFFERKRLWWFLAMGILAMWTRSDGGFAFAMMGMYALWHRRPWMWSLVPVVLGVGWVAVCVKVLIPLFRADHGFLYGFLFSWLGDGPVAMIQTILMRPGYVLTHILTWEKMRYLVDLFGPLLFLPLLKPDILMIALPSLMINLLSPDHIHWSIRYHYQAFLIPFLLIATLYAVVDGCRWVSAKRHQRQRSQRQDDDTDDRKQFQAHSQAQNALWLQRRVGWGVGMLVAATLIANLTLRTPLIHLFTRDRDNEHIAAAHRLLERVPDDAAVTATSAFGAHLARRRELYFFPGNIIYPPTFAERGEYLIADLREVPPDALIQLRTWQASDRWRTVVDEGEFVLLERVHERL